LDQWKRNTYIMWFVVFLSAICWQMVMPFMPVFLGELGVTHGAEFYAGFVVAVSSMCNAIMSPIWGAVGDRLGRKPMMLRAAFFLALGYGLMALVQAPWQVVAIRMMIGILSGFVPMAIALVGVSTPREHVGMALGLVQTAWPSGALIGPMLGGAVADWVGLRAAMWVSAALIFLVLGVVATTVTEPFTPPPPKRKSLMADLRVAVTNPVLVPIIVVTALAGAAATALDPVLVLFSKNLMGPSAPSWLAGLLYAVPGVAFIVTAPWWARRGEEMGFDRTVAIGLLLSAVVYVPQALVGGPWQLGAVRLGVGFVGAPIAPGVAALLATVVPRDLRGRAFGLNQTASAVGAVVGPLAGGAVGSFVGPGGAFILGAAFMLAGYLWVRQVLTPRLRANSALMGTTFEL